MVTIGVLVGEVLKSSATTFRSLGFASLALAHQTTKGLLPLSGWHLTDLFSPVLRSGTLLHNMPASVLIGSERAGYCYNKAVGLAIHLQLRIYPPKGPLFT